MRKGTTAYTRTFTSLARKDVNHRVLVLSFESLRAHTYMLAFITFFPWMQSSMGCTLIPVTQMSLFSWVQAKLTKRNSTRASQAHTCIGLRRLTLVWTIQSGGRVRRRCWLGHLLLILPETREPIESLLSTTGSRTIPLATQTPYFPSMASLGPQPNVSPTQQVRPCIGASLIRHALSMRCTCTVFTSRLTASAIALTSFNIPNPNAARSSPKASNPVIPLR